MVVTGVLPWDRAVSAVDAHTLVLLFGMMIVAVYLRLSGFFRLVTDWAVTQARTPSGLLAMIVVASGGLSALFVNDVVCLVMVPVVLDAIRRLRLPPLPYLVALATAANVGSVATLTGNPQNMLIGSFSGIPYRTFLFHEVAVAVIGLVVVFVVIRHRYRHELPAALELAALPVRYPVHYGLMAKTLAVVLIMLGAFLAGVPIALVAIAGAAYTLLTRRVNPDKVYREIDWKLLVLFSGLFVVIGGVEASGLARELLDVAAAASFYRPAVLTVVTAILSNLVSNVPAVLLFKSVIPTFGEPTRGWLILAMASTLAGNLTIVGSVANLIVVEEARANGIQIGFFDYCRIGVPITIVTLFVGWLVLIALPV
jgi:Na+/H+ antiporter NhaD/arsenite permease-like protein